jgi:hypothetical protein
MGVMCISTASAYISTTSGTPAHKHHYLNSVIVKGVIVTLGLSDFVSVANMESIKKQYNKVDQRLRRDRSRNKAVESP